MKYEGLNPTSNTYTAYIVKKIKINGFTERFVFCKAELIIVISCNLTTVINLQQSRRCLDSNINLIKNE